MNEHDPGTPSTRPPLGFARFRRRATRMLENRAELKDLGMAALYRAEDNGGRIAQVFDELQTLVRMMNAWVRRDYRDLPRTTVIMIVAAVLYFVVPTDVIPDFIVGIGFIDDVAVIGWVTRELRKEIEAFRRWELQLDGSETFIGRSPLRGDGDGD